MEILIQIKDKIAKPVGEPMIVCDNSDYILRFEFDAPWKTQALKTARFCFMQDGEAKYIDVPFAGDQVPAPMPGSINGLFVGVYAGNLQTTTPAYIPCTPSIRDGAPAPAEPMQDVYDQIIALINEGAVRGETGQRGADGKTFRVWLVSDLNAQDCLYDFIYLDKLAGAEVPSEANVNTGDMLICKDGGVVYIKEVQHIGSTPVIVSTAGNGGYEPAVVLKGDKGDKGEQGIQGPKGETGATGAQGPKGDTGATGPAGAPGAAGIKGDKGDKGDPGERGADGAAGVKGDKGEKGDSGVTPVFSIGTVETLDADAEATASVTGTAEAPVLNLGIPKGAGGGSGISDTQVNVSATGASDDVNILAAINSLPENGGTVYLAAGDYNITSTIEFTKNNVRIVGANAHDMTGTAKTEVNIKGSVGAFKPNGKGFWIHGLNIVCTAASPSWSAVNLAGVSGNIEMAQCRFENWATGVYDMGRARGMVATVIGCSFKACTTGVSQPENSKIIDNVFVSCGTGISLPDGCTIFGNAIFDCDIGIGKVSYGNNTITGNTIKRGKGIAADYTDDRHTILIGDSMSLSGQTRVWYGTHNYIANNLLYGKDVTISNQDIAESFALEDLATCTIRDNLVAQPDWNARKGEAGHILNRTHWEESGAVELISETNWQDESDGICYYGDCIGLEAGKTYIVNWNGTVYKCEALAFTMEGTDGVSIGCLGVMGVSGAPNNGEPFVFMDSPSESMGVGLAADGSISGTYSLVGDNYSLHKLDNKFLDLEWMAQGGQEQIEGVILPEVTETFADILAMHTFGDIATNQEQLKEGDNLRVTWDGETSDWTVKYAELPGIGQTFLYFGNLGGFYLNVFGTNVGVPDTGEPFFVILENNGVRRSGLDVELVLKEEIGTHTFSIEAVSKLVKMPEKYLDELSQVVLKSTTEGSTKRFKITVDDSGAIVATEITD